MKANSDYEHLRDWYLARLRKLSLQTELELSLTPGALILADKENIERIILQSKESQQPKTTLSGTAIGFECLFILAACAFACLFFFELMTVKF